MRRGAVADLLPVLAVEEHHFVTVDGHIGAALACTGINLAIQSDEAAATIAALFADTLNYLPLGAHLELLVVNDPLRAEEWVPQHCAQFHPPTGLAPYVGHLAEAYRPGTRRPAHPGSPVLRDPLVARHRGRAPPTHHAAGAADAPGGAQRDPRHADAGGERARARARRTGDRRHAARAAGAAGPPVAVRQPDVEPGRRRHPTARPRPPICAPSATGSARAGSCGARTCSAWIAATRRR